MSGYDLVDSNGLFLVTRDGFVADDACTSECCSGCPSWRELIRCDQAGASECIPPTQPHAWICSSVKCTSGEPLAAGTVVFIDDHCWVVQPGTQPTPPIGADIIVSLAPVQCVQNCTQTPCPSGDLWYRAIPCSPEREVIYVCGVTRCVIRGCYKIDPATGGIPFSQIPPGSITRQLGDLPPGESTTCCDCESEACATAPLTIGFPDSTDPCYGSAANRTCCCATTRDEAGLRHAIGRLRTTQWECSQTVSRPGFTLTTNVYILPGSRQVDANGCETFIVESSQTFNGGSPTIVDGQRIGLSCEACGQWRLRAPRELISPPFLPFQTVVGDEGREWGADCRGYSDPFNQVVLTVPQWSATWECTQQTQVASYHWVDGINGTIIDTTFRYAGAIVRPDGSPGDPCNDRCRGRVRPSMTPGQTGGDIGGAGPVNAPGCSGCGSGQARSRV